jgi:hypothetical protein
VIHQLATIEPGSIHSNIVSVNGATGMDCGSPPFKPEGQIEAMMELKKEVTLDFDCCECDHPVGVTLRCEGKGLGAGLRTVAAVHVPCPTCGALNRLLFEPSGRVHGVTPCTSLRPLPEPSLN